MTGVQTCALPILQPPSDKHEGGYNAVAGMGGAADGRGPSLPGRGKANPHGWMNTKETKPRDDCGPNPNRATTMENKVSNILRFSLACEAHSTIRPTMANEMVRDSNYVSDDKPSKERSFG